MAQKGIIIEKPDVIKNWLIFGNFVDAVLVNFQQNKWDGTLKKNVLEVEYVPTKDMKWNEQIDYGEETDFNRTTGTFKCTYPMDMVGHIEPRTEGTWILMLCDYKGEKCDIFEKIDLNLWNKNRKQANQIISLNSILIGMRAEMDEMIKHPTENLKRLYKMAQVAKDSMTPAYYGQGENSSQQPPPPEGEQHG